MHPILLAEVTHGNPWPGADPHLPPAPRPTSREGIVRRETVQWDHRDVSRGTATERPSPPPATPENTTSERDETVKIYTRYQVYVTAQITSSLSGGHVTPAFVEVYMRP